TFSLCQSSRLLLPPTPLSSRFPYTTLFRSRRDLAALLRLEAHRHLALATDQVLGEAILQIEEAVRVAQAELLVADAAAVDLNPRSEEHTSELQSRFDLVCRLLLDKKKPHAS